MIEKAFSLGVSLPPLKIVPVTGAFSPGVPLPLANGARTHTGAPAFLFSLLFLILFDFPHDL
jgi:hypothetical protein